MNAIAIVYDATAPADKLQKVFDTIGAIHKNEIADDRLILVYTHHTPNKNYYRMFPVCIRMWHGKALYEQAAHLLKQFLFAVVYVVGTKTEMMRYEVDVYYSVGIKIVAIPID